MLGRGNRCVELDFGDRLIPAMHQMSLIRTKLNYKVELQLHQNAEHECHTGDTTSKVLELSALSA